MSRWFAGAVLLPLCLGVADGAPPQVERRNIVNRIVAIVDDVVITKRDIDRRAGSGQPAAHIVEELIEQHLLAAEAERRRLTAEASEIDAALAEIAQQNKLTVKQIFEAAAQQGFSEAEYRTELRRQLVELRVINSHLADEVTQGGAPPADGMEGARKRLVASLRTHAFVEVRL